MDSLTPTQRSATDPVLLALTQNRLDHVCRQMGWVMSQTALSPIFNQSHDFSCFITGGDGEIISQADGLPAHAAGGGFAVRALLAAFGDDIAEGDVFLMNDPYLGGGNHLPDWVIATPVFVEGRRIAFACDRAHQSDIGGGAPGTYNGDATEIFQEGLRLPPVRVIAGGAVRRDVWQILLANSRTPELLDGDLQAMIGATRIGAERIEALAREIGADKVLATFAAVLDHADACFRAIVTRLPDGLYEGEEHSDNDCFGPGRFAVRVAITVAGDRLTLDFGGTDPQMRGFKNSPVANTHSMTYVGLASFLGGDIPINEGTFRSARLILPPGSLVNPRPPAPQTMSTMYMGHEIIHAVWRALAQADPQRACAGWGKTVHGISTGFHRAGEPYVLYHWNCVSAAGAVAERDGFHQIGILGALGGLTVPNVEAYERLYPVRVHRHEIRCDSAGPGERRGGAGVEYEASVAGEVVQSFRSEGLTYAAAFGVSGGGDGADAEMVVESQGRRVEDVPLYGKRTLSDPLFKVRSAAGGGWGDPRRRDPALVARDVLDGIVSAGAAREVYGVVVDPATGTVDGEATARLRAV
ncbi:MAG: hydantoinase B/oxoprolinase family protein [Reyranellaceae bacterium]